MSGMMHWLCGGVARRFPGTAGAGLAFVSVVSMLAMEKGDLHGCRSSSPQTCAHYVGAGACVRCVRSLALLLVVWHASIMPGAARCLLPAAKVNVGVQQQTAAGFLLSIRLRRNAWGIKCHCLCAGCCGLQV